MTYEDFKDLTGRTASDKILRDKTFNIATNPKYDMAAVLKIKSFLIMNQQKNYTKQLLENSRKEK